MKRAAVVVPLVLVVACGSSGPGKAAYVKKAEAICAKANADRKALAFPSTPAGFGPYVSTLLQLGDATARQLSALKPPAKDKAALEQKVLVPLSAAVAQGRTFLGKVKAAIAANDTALLQQLLLSPPTVPQPTLAYMRAYGLRSCADAATFAG